MEKKTLTEKINSNPKGYLYTGITVAVVGLVMNLFNSAYLKPMFTDTTTGNIVCNLISAATAFCALLGFVIFTSSWTAMNEAKKNKNRKRNKKK